MSSPVTFDRRGALLRITAPAGISHHDQRVIGGTPWLTANAYFATHQYETTYLELGATPSSHREDQGVLPTLFEGPAGAAWAVVTNPYGPRDREVLRPVGGTPVGEPFPPFVGEPLWREGDALVLGRSPKKADHWLRLDLRTGKRKLLPLVEKGLAHFQRGEEGVHGLGRTAHCLLSPEGGTVRQRALDLSSLNVQPDVLRFDGMSTLFATDLETLFRLDIGPDGKMDSRPLTPGSFYSLYPVEHLTGGSSVLRWVGEHGNGWSVVRDGQLVSHVRSDETGYVDQDGRRVVELPRGDWVLSGLSALGDRLLATVYPRSRIPEALWVAQV